MVDLNDPLQLLAIVVPIIAGITATVIQIIRFIEKRKEKPHPFLYEKFPEDKIWKIRILHPIQAIQQCSIKLDGKPLSLSGLEDRFVCSIEIGGGQNFVIPMGAWKDNSKIVIEYDGKKIKTTFKRIHTATR